MLFELLFGKPVKTSVQGDVAIHTPTEECCPLKAADYINRNIQKWQDRNSLWDMRTYNFSILNYNDLSRFLNAVEAATVKRANLKTAILVNSNVGYGVTRMFLTMAEGRKIEVRLRCYDDREEALEWLRSSL